MPAEKITDNLRLKKGSIISSIMGEDGQKASEFANALYDSGFDFEEIAERQHRMAKSAGRYAIAWSAFTLTFLGAAGYSCAKEPRDRLLFELPAETLIIAGSVLNGRNEMRELGRLLRERENSLQLTEMVNSAKSQNT